MRGRCTGAETELWIHSGRFGAPADEIRGMIQCMWKQRSFHFTQALQASEKQDSGALKGALN